jgi:hypothetical protein
MTIYTPVRRQGAVISVDEKEEEKEKKETGGIYPAPASSKSLVCDGWHDDGHPFVQNLVMTCHAYLVQGHKLLELGR